MQPIYANIAIRWLGQPAVILALGKIDIPTPPMLFANRNKKQQIKMDTKHDPLPVRTSLQFPFGKKHMGQSAGCSMGGLPFSLPVFNPIALTHPDLTDLTLELGLKFCHVHLYLSQEKPDPPPV